MKFILALLKSEYVKSVSVLMAGTLLSQFIMAASSVFLTRLYTPESFGQFTIFTSLLAIVGGIVTLKYELAIPLAKSEPEAINIFTLSFLCTLSISLIFVVLTNTYIYFSPINPHKLVLRYVSLALVAVGFYQTFNYLLIYLNQYRTLALAKVLLSLTMVLGQILLAVSEWSTNQGLILGMIIGQFLVVVFLFRAVPNIGNQLPFRFEFAKNRYQTLKAIALEYSKFPKYSSFSAVLSSLSLFLPSLLIVYGFGTSIGGLFALSERVLKIPLAIIGNAIGQVYLGKAGKLIQQFPSGSHKLRLFFQRLSVLLLVLGCIILFPIGFFAPKGFGFIFGSDWYQAGEFVQISISMFIAQFVINPLSQTFNLLEAQKTFLILDIIRVVSTVLVFSISFWFKWSVITTIGIYNLLMTLAYIAFWLLAYRLLKKFELIHSNRR